MSTGNSRVPAVESSRLEQRILDHFRGNSRAMDSAEGVARFWVGENHHVVERCLIDLHHRGLLQKQTIAGTDLYSLEQDLSTESSLVDTLQKRNLELKETVARLAAVNEIGKATTGLLNLQELYDSLVRMVAQHLQARRVSILVCEPGGDSMSLVASMGITKREALECSLQLGEGIAGQVAASQEPLLVEDIERTELKSLRRGTGYKTPSFMIAPVSFPIRYQRKRVGVINASDKRSGDPFNEQDLEFLSTLSSQLAVAIEHAHLVKEMENGYLAVLVDLIQAVEDSCPKTRGQSRRVAELAGSLARAMGLAEPRIQLLVQAAALHSVGRLSTRSDGDEGAAERVLAPIATLREVREIILHSTHPVDATRTVLGVDRPGIPVESRILAVCEEFVRRTAGNERDAKVRRQALEAIGKRVGKHDPDVVAALGRLTRAGEAR